MLYSTVSPCDTSTLYRRSLSLSSDRAAAAGGGGRGGTAAATRTIWQCNLACNSRAMDGTRSRHSSLAPLVLLLCLVPRASGLATPAPDFSLLSRRIASQQADEATVQCLLLDAMLPRQRLTFQFGPPVSTTLSEVRKEKGMLAVVGINPRTGDVLKRGVEARIESMSP